jgi:hypothetical protein
MKRVKGGGLREMMKRAGEVESRQDEEVPAIREVPKQQAESPPIATYLDPDAENGRPRIVIMLTEDGERIEHLFYTKMSYVQATSNLSTMLNIHTQYLLRHLVEVETEHGRLVAEVEFLRDKLARSIPPPRDVVHPAPKMPLMAGEDVD